MAYTTVYNLGLDKGEIMAAMNYARTTDIRSPHQSNELTRGPLGEFSTFVYRGS